MRNQPLWGTQTHPFKPASRTVRAGIRHKTIPCQEINQGVVDRLTRGLEPLAKVVQGPNPYPTTQKKQPTINPLQISEAGIRELDDHV